MKRYLARTCAEVPNDMLVKAFAEYLDDRELWQTDDKGRTRPVGQRHFGICALCGESLAAHFVVIHDGKATDIGPKHAKYEAVREAFTSNTTPAGAMVFPRYFCEDAISRKVGRLPIRLAEHENPRVADIYAPDAAESLRDRRKTEREAIAASEAAKREREAAKPAATSSRVKGGL